MTICVILTNEKITAGPPLKQLLHRHHLQMDFLHQNPEEKNNHNFSKVDICIFYAAISSKILFLEHSKISLNYCDKNQGMKNTLYRFPNFWSIFVGSLILIAVFIFTIISCVIMYFLVILYHCFVFVVHIMWVILVFVGHTCSCICGSYLPLCFALHFYLGSHWLVYLWWVILVSTRKVCPLQLFLRCPTFADPCRWTRQRFRQRRLRTDSLRRNPEMESLSTDVCVFNVVMDKS